MNKASKQPSVNPRKRCTACKRFRAIPEGRKKCSGCRKFEGLIASGTLKGPDYTEVNTRNYKDPMQKVEKGFGYFGALTETNDGEFIQCHICGYYFAALGSHIRMRHHMKPSTYNIRYGLRIRDGLLSSSARQRAQDNYNKYARKTPEQFREMSLRGAKVIKKKRGGNMWSAQTRNEKGNCRDQTIAKIRDLAERMGGAPTITAFCQDYGKGQPDVIKTHFGSWASALKVAGVKSFAEKRSEDRDRRMADLLVKMRDFYEEHGRTPLYADFKNNRELPDPNTIRAYYGSMNEARREAGVPMLVCVGPGRWVEKSA